ncbi:hypothetical protein PMAYCL1PPCAC_18821, partial [Pristionchus mayeri]
QEVAKLVPKNRLMSESEWRSLGIQQSPGWVHYMIHPPERHVLLFRRPLPKNTAMTTGGAAAVGKKMAAQATDFYYSTKYEDDMYEYRHVHAPKVLNEVLKLIPKNRLMTEGEWRALGIQQSPGWVHYMIHPPERHVLLFRRPL